MIRLFEHSLGLRRLLGAEYRKPTIILLVATLAAVTWRYYGTKAFYLEHLSGITALAGGEQMTAAVFTFLSAFLLLAVIPMVVIRFVLREPLSRYGIQWGDVRFGWKAVAVVTPVMILLSYPSASSPAFLAEYPLNPNAGNSPGDFVQHALFYLFFYIGWEFCFRGFVQFGLRDSIGDWNAILVQMALSTIVHIGKPAGEIYSSILGALLWGVIAYRSRSLLYPILTHWPLGIALDLFIVTSSPASVLP